MSNLPYEIIEKIICNVDLKQLVGDSIFNIFLIKECKLINQKRLFNAFVHANCYESLCFLLLQHQAH